MYLCISMEVGPGDVKNNQILVRRDNSQKITEKSDGLVQRIQVKFSKDRILNNAKKASNP